MKKLLVLFLALTLLVTGAFLMTSCGDDTDDNGGNTDSGNTDNNNGGSNDEGNAATKVDYVLTLKDQNGDAVEGVKVTFRVGPKTTYEATTNAAGKATINIEETSLPIRATIPAQLPSGYSVDSAQFVDFASGAKTAELSVIKAIAHTIYVKDGAGNAVAGANVQVCVNGTCQSAVVTDSEGKAVFYVRPGFEEAYAQFNTAPDGYNAPETNKIYYTNGDTEATFVVTET